MQNLIKRPVPALLCLALTPMVCAGAAPARASDAEIFHPGLISSGQEYGLTFSPDGDIIYFTRGNDIFWSRKSSDSWEKPQIAAFSKGQWIADYLPDGANVDYFNWDPVISPDGSSLYIMSHGLVDGKIIDGEDGEIDLWVLPREGAGFDGNAWGKPRHLGPPISLAGHSEGAAGVDNSGTIYFFSRGRADSIGGGDIYYSKLEDGQYKTAIHMGEGINTGKFDGHVYAAPDGKFILFISNNGPGSFGSCDIYVSWKSVDGWGEPRNLGTKVNTEQCEITPSLSRNGEILYFGRIEDWDSDERNIYSIDLQHTDFFKGADASSK